MLKSCIALLIFFDFPKFSVNVNPNKDYPKSLAANQFIKILKTYISYVDKPILYI